MLTERLDIRKQPIISWHVKDLRSFSGLRGGSRRRNSCVIFTSECNRIDRKLLHSAVLLSNVLIKPLHEITELCISHLLRRLGPLKRVVQLTNLTLAGLGIGFGEMISLSEIRVEAAMGHS